MVIVLSQPNYQVLVNHESCILSNDVLMKCAVPSHVQDFVKVSSWKIISNPKNNKESNLVVKAEKRDAGKLDDIKCPSFLCCYFDVAFTQNKIFVGCIMEAIFLVQIY